ncbi:MAG: phosphopantothenoylcysteine decarboxylase [Lentisphaerae bacterium]|nr:phosphopantothenoylcysteine decarboxylase [Lentisphaerota bacterium]MCP4102222.1 phosphopantothenoylcysteine decarboxylase [Lentisphaerota bacterium]
MSDKSKKCIVLGVTGGIAAYKAADLCSKMVQAGYDVHVIMTASALELITERTFLTLSRNPVTTTLWDVPIWQPEHIALAERADLLVVAPCTANFIGKYTHGIGDDALTTFALAHTEKVLLAPAMNPRMWQNAAVKENIEILKTRDVEFIGPEPGRVACGDDGLGRMAEPVEILEQVKRLF